MCFLRVAIWILQRGEFTFLSLCVVGAGEEWDWDVVGVGDAMDLGVIGIQLTPFHHQIRRPLQRDPAHRRC